MASLVLDGDARLFDGFFFLSSSELLKYIFGAKHSRGSSVCEICPRLDKDKFWPHKRISVAAQLVSSGQSLGFYAMNIEYTSQTQRKTFKFRCTVYIY